MPINQLVADDLADLEDLSVSTLTITYASADPRSGGRVCCGCSCLCNESQCYCCCCR